MDYSVNGSMESEYVRSLTEKVQDTKNKLAQLDAQYGALSTISENQASDYITRRKQIMNEQRNFSIQFIIEHLNSLASIYALYQTTAPGQLILGENKDIQYMKIVADSLSVSYPEAAFVQSFVADARSTESKYYNLSGLSKKLEEASYGLPDLKLPDANGDSISLAALKGKTVLLYFWGSFSKESRQINPSLLEVYKKNKKAGFEVYAISLDKEKSNWLNAVRYDELEWINVNDKEEGNSEAAHLYNVKSLPATYLINKSGEVIARDIYGKELQKWLDNIL
jgi:peroxiredoxin